MTDDLMLRRKWTLRAHGEQVVFVKKVNERAEHVLMKAFLWALYLPLYPDLLIEIRVDDRYKPDVVSLDTNPWTGAGEWPRFWGEAGQVGVDKIHSLARRYRETHFAIAKWDTNLEPLIEIVSEALKDLKRTAPFDLFNFSPDSAERFIDARGYIRVTFDDLEWTRL